MTILLRTDAASASGLHVELPEVCLTTFSRPESWTQTSLNCRMETSKKHLKYLQSSLNHRSRLRGYGQNSFDDVGKSTMHWLGSNPRCRRTIEHGAECHSSRWTQWSGLSIQRTMHSTSLTSLGNFHSLQLLCSQRNRPSWCSLKNWPGAYLAQHPTLVWLSFIEFPHFPMFKRVWNEQWLVCILSSSNSLELVLWFVYSRANFCWVFQADYSQTKSEIVWAASCKKKRTWPCSTVPSVSHPFPKSICFWAYFTHKGSQRCNGPRCSPRFPSHVWPCLSLPIWVMLSWESASAARRCSILAKVSTSRFPSPVRFGHDYWKILEACLCQRCHGRNM